MSILPPAASTGIFRIHDIDGEPPAGDVGAPAGIFRQLSHDWSRLCAPPSARHAVQCWAATDAIFEGVASPGQLVDRIDAGGERDADRLLLALVRLAQGGHQLAARVVLQAMLPKLARMTRTTRPSSNDNRLMDDRAHITVVTFWEVVYAYPTDRRPDRVAANLALDTLHRLTNDLRKPPADIPMDPEETAGHLARASEARATGSLTTGASMTGDDTLQPTDQPSSDADLLEVIAWALDVAAISPREAAILVRVYLPPAEEPTRGELAKEMGISHEALRQRTSRARRRLIAAVRDAADHVSDPASQAPPLDCSLQVRTSGARGLPSGRSRHGS